MEKGGDFQSRLDSIYEVVEQSRHQIRISDHQMAAATAPQESQAAQNIYILNCINLDTLSV